MRDYVLPGLLPGKVGSIVSPGGVGKSIIALLFAHLVAGVDMLGLGEFRTGRAVYLSAEDDGDILHERLHAIGARLTEPQREACAKSILVEDLTRFTPDLLHGEKAQAWRDALERLATGSRLLILDTLRSFHSADENDGTQMALLIGHIRAMAARTGCAIVFLHHSSKAMAISGQGDSQQAARGSSVLTDNIRWQSYLAGMAEEESKKLAPGDAGEPVGPESRRLYVRFGISKQNYGSPYGERWFRRGSGGIFEPVNLRHIEKEKQSKGKKGDWRGHDI